jgi:hypothetical protein
MELVENSGVGSKMPRRLVFVIQLVDPGLAKPVAFAETAGMSAVVRIEHEEVGFTFTGAQTERAAVFAESWARQVALLAIEKDFPEGIGPSLSAKQIDSIPPEFENRLPNFCVNGNEVWLVDP